MFAKAYIFNALNILRIGFMVILPKRTRCLSLPKKHSEITKGLPVCPSLTFDSCGSANCIQLSDATDCMFQFVVFLCDAALFQGVIACY